LLGLPMGCDVCYTNHAEADQDDMDALLTLLGVAGCTYIMGVPGADDVMLSYQSSSFHDALYLRRVLGKRPAPEFEAWLERIGITRGGQPIRRRTPRRDHRAVAPTAGRARMSEPAALSWPALRRATPARIGLGRSGTALPTAAHLDFQLAHALARDAVHAVFDPASVAAAVERSGLDPLVLRSAASDRAIYLRRPDLGRRLDADSRERLAVHPPSPIDIVFVIADGLSATAVHAHAGALLQATVARLAGALRVGPVAIVTGGRVAIGERPGLSAADSLGVYLTWQPAPGTVDAARHCLSNIRPQGLPIPEAAERLAGLIRAARRHRMTGVALSGRLASEESRLIDRAR
jgi:ethanolamine ammonia-lyase small subunit